MQSPFLQVPDSDWVVSNRSAFAIRDRKPVTEGHTLVVPRRLISSWWEASLDEQVDMLQLADEVRRALDNELAPDGYTVGIDVGEAAGQTVEHLHLHIIPHWYSDGAGSPRGIRNVIPPGRRTEQSSSRRAQTPLKVRTKHQQTATKSTRKQRIKNVVAQLVDVGAVPVGEVFTFDVSQVSSSDREEVTGWIAQDPRRGRARWEDESPVCLRWEADEKRYSTTGLAKQILKLAVGREGALQGPLYWKDGDGQRPDQILEEHLGGPVYQRPQQARDWSLLHRLLEDMPAGTWTTYGDLADAIGSSARGVGQHVRSCSDCVGPHRVLERDGTISSHFRWPDPDQTDDPRTLLRGEGIRLDKDGHASPSRKYRIPRS